MSTIIPIPDMTHELGPIPAKEAIVAMFSEAGMSVEVVERCDDLTCPACCVPVADRAA